MNVRPEHCQLKNDDAVQPRARRDLFLQLLIQIRNQHAGLTWTFCWFWIHRGKEQMSFTCVRYMGVSSSVTFSANDWFCELTAGAFKYASPSGIS